MQQVEVIDRPEYHQEPSVGNLPPFLPSEPGNATLPPPLPAVPPALPQLAAAGRVGSVFGLDPRIAVLATVTDLILFAGDIVTIGGFVPMAVIFAFGLGFITYKAQIAWQNDDRNSALIKAMIVTFLTALPGPITPIFAIPGGIIGMVKAIRRP